MAVHHDVLATVLLSLLLTSCSGGPQPRLPAYVGPGALAAEPRPGEAGLPPEGELVAGLLVVNDTSAPGAAPEMTPEMLAELKRVLGNRMQKEIPALRLEKEILLPGAAPEENAEQFVRAARDGGVGYILLAIFSSVESEFPAYLPLTGVPRVGGAGLGTRPGYEVRNLARVELALLDGDRGDVVVHADGEAFATLYRLDIDLKSNTYPVVFRDRTDIPIYPEYDAAYDVLRGVATNSAINEAVMHLRAAWAVVASQMIAAPPTASASLAPPSDQPGTLRDVPLPGG